ncbi:MAG: DNA-directed RNA polymerase subunit omega [Bacteroidetes bacterium]|nr:DNA-directed RNA polymerase subunit omega [Bacteroidota bacterium]MBS1945907.1 DNA-directed RNA polymerase subunit omega [Bacteroidota bacterium]
MNPHYLQAAKTTVTRDVNRMDTETGNIYETIAILGKRANQIAVEVKEEINHRMEEFTVSGENIEEIYENREQIELSKQFERMPKPSTIAVEELMHGRIVFRRPEPGVKEAQ